MDGVMVVTDRTSPDTRRLTEPRKWPVLREGGRGRTAKKKYYQWDEEEWTKMLNDPKNTIFVGLVVEQPYMIGICELRYEFELRMYLFFPNLQFLTMLETAGFVKRLEVIVLETGFCKWDPNWLVPPAVLWHSHQHAYIKGSKGTPKTIFGHFFIIMNKMIQIFSFLSLSSLIVLLMIRSGVATVERQVTFLIFPLLKKSLQLILLPLMKHTWYLSFLVLHRII